MSESKTTNESLKDDMKAFRPLEDTEEVVEKFTHKGVPVIITKNSDTVKVGSMPYELYINFDHHDHYESVEQATHEAKLEIEDQEMSAADRTDPDQMKLFKDSQSESCGGVTPQMPPPALPAPEDKGDQVSMNVSINARGKDHVADLIDIMKNAGVTKPEPVTAKMMPMRLDMEKFKDIVDGPMSRKSYGSGIDNRPGEEYMSSDELMSGGDDLHKQKHPADLRVKDPSGFDGMEDQVEEWDNAPDEKHSDHNYMIKDLSGGINKSKKMFKKAQDGDNAMTAEQTRHRSIKDQLYAMLENKKAKPDFLDIDGDGDTKEPMKKAAKDAKKKKADTKKD